jgi:ribonuclease D
MQNKRVFQLEIEKEDIEKLALGGYNGDIELIDTPALLTQVLPEILSEKVIGFDTETKPSFKKGVIHQVSLLQIATANKVFVIRLNKVGLPNELKQMFKAHDVIKIGIACMDDMKDLNKLNESFVSHNIIDLNRECPKVGFRSIGAKKLTALVLGVKISKRQQTSNWEAQQLSEAQLNYAATDAWICREIYLQLIQNGYKLQTTLR